MSTYGTHASRSGTFRLGFMGAAGVFPLLVLMTLNNTDLAVAPVGFAAIACLLGGGNFLLLARTSLRPAVPAGMKHILLAALLFAAMYLIGVFQKSNMSSVKNAGQVVLVLGFFGGVALSSWKKKSLWVLGWGSAAYTIFLVFWWGATGMPADFSGYVKNPNMLGAFLFYVSFFLFAVRGLSERRWVWNVLVVISIVGVVATGSRAPVLALLASLITYAAWGWITKSRFRFRAYLIAALASVLAFTYCYAVLRNHPQASYWNVMVREYTGGNLWSGREELWFPLIELIRDRSLLGYGAGVKPESFWYTGLSSHNLYLQTSLQVGSLGLAALSYLFYSIWNFYWRAKNDALVRLCASFLIGILVYATFEVSLTQTNLTVGVLEWMILALGVSKTCEVMRESEPTQERAESPEAFRLSRSVRS